MKVVISVIKADVGSIGGHIKPSQKLKDGSANYIHENKKDFLLKLNVLTLKKVSFMINALCVIQAVVICLLLWREKQMLDIIRDLLKKRSGR